MGPPAWVAGFHTELVKEMQGMNTTLKYNIVKSFKRLEATIIGLTAKNEELSKLNEDENESLNVLLRRQDY